LAARQTHKTLFTSSRLDCNLIETSYRINGTQAKREERGRQGRSGRGVNADAPLLVSAHNLAFMKNPKYSIAI